MSDRPLILWSRKQRESARARNAALVAYGYDSSSMSGKKGGIQAVGPCDDRAAQIICMFAMKVHHGMDPEQAFAEVMQDVQDFDARQEAKDETPKIEAHNG